MRVDPQHSGEAGQNPTPGLGHGLLCTCSGFSSAALHMLPLGAPFALTLLYAAYTKGQAWVRPAEICPLGTLFIFLF